MRSADKSEQATTSLPVKNIDRLIRGGDSDRTIANTLKVEIGDVKARRHELNAAANTQDADSELRSLKATKKKLTLRAEIASLQRLVEAEDQAARLVEAEWGELVNRREYLSDTPGWGFGTAYDQRISVASDRVGGKFSPFFENEQDLAAIRGAARFLHATDPVAIGALENLVNYTVGNGLTYSVEDREESERDAEQSSIAAEVQAALDEALQANNWIGDQEVECVIRAHRDGEAILWVREHHGRPHVCLVEPAFVTEPYSGQVVADYAGLPADLSWTFGIATHPRDTEIRAAYFVQWHGSAQDWEVAPAHQVVHIRRNVDRGVKRGLSDFFANGINIERSGKLLGNTLQGAAIQATIAYIKEHPSGTNSDAIVSARNARADSTTTFSRPTGGTRQVRQEKFFPGRVIDTVGTKYHAGPMGQSSAPTYIDVMQAGLRVVGARWSMPEYMVSGDASNANYSSTLQAGGPFDKASQRRQGFYKRHFEEVCWKMLAVYCRGGRFRDFGIDSIHRLKRLVQIKIEAPAVAVQDREAEERIRQIRHDAGILSKKTWAAQAELDFEVEVANGAKEASVRQGPLVAQIGGPLSGSGESGPQLNGAQITAAVGVLDGVAAGTTAELPAVELLVAVGIDERTARQMVAATKAKAAAKPPAPPPQFGSQPPPDAQGKPDAKRSAVAAALESVKTTDEAKAVLSEAYP